MTYNPAIPQPSDFLNVSQGQILANFGKADTSFGIDHYKFSDLTASNGFHNQVTTPGFVTNPPSVPVVPPTTTTFPIFYGFQPLDAGGMPTTQVGLIQYSRGPTNAVPTPLTHLHSTSSAVVIGAGGTANVLDFAGIPRAFCTIYVMDTTSAITLNNSRITTEIFWTGAPTSAFSINNLIIGAIPLIIQASGTIIQIKNNGAALNNVYWTLEMQRLS
jgi:hypothetical protein